MTHQEIANELGISRTTVTSRIKRFGTAYITPEQAKTGPKTHGLSDGIKRRCLCCRAQFNSTGRFNRRCPSCTAELGNVRPADSIWLKVCL